MKKSSILILTAVLLAAALSDTVAQTDSFPAPPAMKSYKGVKGRVNKYHNFNYIDIRQQDGSGVRQALGNYWEISYVYDSVFRQKRKFRDFIANQVAERQGTTFFEDTTQLHFLIPASEGNIWGRLVLANDKVYRLRLIREKAFINTLVFDKPVDARFDQFVEPVVWPPRIGYLPNSVVTRAAYSKFDHQEFTWNVKDTLFRQKLMGPYWELKIDVRNAANEVDKTMSTVEIMESYYRACTKAGGTVLKSRPRELIFTLPLQKSVLWCRITVSLDGVYLVKALIQSDDDRTPPSKMVSVAPAQADTTKTDPGKSNRPD